MVSHARFWTKSGIPKEMIRVLQVVQRLYRGGVEAFLMNNLREIDHDDFTVDFMSLLAEYSPYAEEVRSYGSRFFCVHANFFAVRQLPVAFWRTYRAMRSGHYDVVHAEVNLENGMVLLAAFLARVPVRVSHAHNTGLYQADGGRIRRFVVNDLSRFLIRKFATVRLACGKEAGAELYGCPPESDTFTVIHNGIPLHRFLIDESRDDKSFRRSIDVPEGCRLYGNISRFDIQKNLEFAVCVFAEIHRRDPDSMLVLGGLDGDRHQAVLDKVSELGLVDAVRILGECSDMAPVYASVDCYIFPSRFEGLPFALLEAQASGLPVVASANVPQEVDLGLGLVTFHSLDDDVSIWADAAMKSERLTDRARISEVFVRRGYDIKDSCRKLEEIYRTSVAR